MSYSLGWVLKSILRDFNTFWIHEYDALIINEIFICFGNIFSEIFIDCLVVVLLLFALPPCDCSMACLKADRKSWMILFFLFYCIWIFDLFVFLSVSLFPFQSVLLQPSAHGGVVGGGGVGGSYPPADSWNQHRPEHTALWSPNMEVCAHKHISCRNVIKHDFV